VGLRAGLDAREKEKKSLAPAGIEIAVSSPPLA